MELQRLSLRRDLPRITALLESCGIRMADGLDTLIGLTEGDALLACAGRRGNVIECAAVAPEARGEGLLNRLVTELLTQIRAQGHDGAFVFTKPASAAQFASLGFTQLAETAEAALLYSRRDGVARWAAGLPELPGAGDGREIGCVVMNANPFTRGHRYLLERAYARCEALYVFVVEHDGSRFPFSDRLRLVRAGTRELTNLCVCPGGPFIISKATFPSYFLKRADDVARVHAEVDARVFGAWIAPALGITTRFVGSEPIDALTRRYNCALQTVLPACGVAVETVERLMVGGEPVSASRVRALLDAGRLDETRPLVPAATLENLSRCAGAAERGPRGGA